LTRPACLAAVSTAARYSDSPAKEHWLAAKKVLKYLKKTSKFGLLYTSTGKTMEEEWDLSMYVDADHAGDVDSRKSRYGFIIKLNGNIVDFATGLQRRVSASTTESEYVALAHGLKELLWTKQIVEELGIKVKQKIIVYEDNQTCIKIAENPMSQKRTRHMDIRYHFIREFVQDGTIKLVYCETQRQQADILTKPLDKTAFTRLRDQLLAENLQDKLAEPD
jgi:hypothetical protein